MTQSANQGNPGFSSAALDHGELHPVSAAQRRHLSIRFWLASLVVACVLPVWLAAGYLIYHNYQSRRALTELRMLETARALSLAVDRDLTSMQTTLSDLATSPAIVSGDRPAAYRSMKQAQLAQPDADIILSDADGQELINTFLPLGAPLPRRGSMEPVRQVYETGRPAIANLYTGASSEKPRVSVDVPVFRDGKVVYDLAMAVSPQRFTKVLLQQHLPPEWVGRIFDSNQKMVSRTRLGDEFVGRSASPGLLHAMRSGTEGTAEAIGLAGILMFNGFSRSQDSGWTVAIGVPKSTMMAQIRRWLLWALLGTALLSFSGIALALLMARRIARSIQSLAAPALALGRGEQVTIGDLNLAETNEVGESLMKASQLIQQRSAERERAEVASREAEGLRHFNAELATSEAEARARATELAAIMEAVPVVTYIAHDPRCELVTGNRAMHDLFGLAPDVDMSRSAWEKNGGPSTFRIFHEGKQLTFDELPVPLAAATGREVRDCGCVIEFSDGSSRCLFGNAVPLFDEAGNVRGAVGAFLDVTERKRATDELLASEARYREKEARYHAIVEGFDGLVYVCSMDHRIEFMNRKLIERIGRDATGELCHMALHERESMCPWCVNDRLSQGETVRWELQSPVDGHWFDIVNTPLFHADGSISKQAMIQDITDRKRAEQELRESEERFRRVVEGAPLGMCVQTDGIFRYLNPAALAMFGAMSNEQIVGQSILERFHPDSRAAILERIRILRKEQKAAPFLDEKYLRLDGSVFDTEVTAAPFTYQGREGIIVFFRDITERKQEEERSRKLEQQLRQAQKMEAIGRLAGGVSHDFNNLLMVIQTYTEMLQDSLPSDDVLRINTGEVLKAAGRAASLTGQLLAFSRKQIINPTVLDLNNVIHETAKMLKRLIGEDLDFRVIPGELLWAIEADSDQIVQILMNLCVNARDAMPQGGTLSVATENVEVRGTGHPYLLPGDYVKLSVTDTGTGISKELQDQIFEPFFTTKPAGKGTGLGLSIVYGIVKQNGGYVWVDSEVDKGTCFSVMLPKVAKPSVAELPAKEAARPKGTETILVVEDEAALREAISDYLQSMGYKVYTASSGQNALAVASEIEHIDLLLTDVVMPKMSGRELSQALTRLRPDLKTIHMSGYTDDAVLRHGIQEHEAHFLQKPFSLSTLARKLRESLQLQ